jgi:hypothetical protein
MSVSTSSIASPEKPNETRPSEGRHSGEALLKHQIQTLFKNYETHGHDADNDANIEVRYIHYLKDDKAAAAIFSSRTNRHGIRKSISSYYTLKEMKRPTPRLLRQIQQKQAEGYNVYFGINLRYKTPRKSGNLTTTSRVSLFILDFDHTTIEDAKNQLMTVGLPTPTVLVNSGHGVHAHYFLDRNLPVKIGDPLFKKFIHHYVLKIRIDTKVCSAAGIIRIPGTINIKADATTHPLCEIVESTSNKHSVQDLGFGGTYTFNEAEWKRLIAQQEREFRAYRENANDPATTAARRLYNERVLRGNAEADRRKPSTLNTFGIKTKETAKQGTNNFSPLIRPVQPQLQPAAKRKGEDRRKLPTLNTFGSRVLQDQLDYYAVAFPLTVRGVRNETLGRLTRKVINDFGPNLSEREQVRIHDYWHDQHCHMTDTPCTESRHDFIRWFKHWQRGYDPKKRQFEITPVPHPLRRLIPAEDTLAIEIADLIHGLWTQYGREGFLSYRQLAGIVGASNDACHRRMKLLGELGLVFLLKRGERRTMKASFWTTDAALISEAIPVAQKQEKRVRKIPVARKVLTKEEREAVQARRQKLSMISHEEFLDAQISPVKGQSQHLNMIDHVEFLEAEHAKTEDGKSGNATGGVPERAGPEAGGGEGAACCPVQAVLRAIDTQYAGSLGSEGLREVGCYGGQDSVGVLC